MRKKIRIPVESTGSEICNKLVAPAIALQILEKHYKGNKIVRDFIALAIKEISSIADLVKDIDKKKHLQENVAKNKS